MILDRRLPPAVTLGPRSSKLASSALSSGTNAVYRGSRRSRRTRQHGGCGQSAKPGDRGAPPATAHGHPAGQPPRTITSPRPYPSRGSRCTGFASAQGPSSATLMRMSRTPSRTLAVNVALAARKRCAESRWRPARLPPDNGQITDRAGAGIHGTWAGWSAASSVPPAPIARGGSLDRLMGNRVGRLGLCGNRYLRCAFSTVHSSRKSCWSRPGGCPDGCCQ
jgi:hypothetical protein